MKGVEEMNWWTEERWEVGSEVAALASGPVGVAGNVWEPFWR